MSLFGKQAKIGFDTSGIRTNDMLASGDLKFSCESGEPHASRCGQCSKMIADGKMVWVADGIKMGDPFPSLIRQQKANQWNGHYTGWCVACVLALIEKARGSAPSIEKAPPPPPPRAPSEEEVAAQKMMQEHHAKRELRKRELRAALISRVLTADEIVEVARHGAHLYIDYHQTSEGLGFSQGYSEKELQNRLLIAWQVQTNLRMAIGGAA